MYVGQHEFLKSCTFDQMLVPYDINRFTKSRVYENCGLRLKAKTKINFGRCR